MRRCRSVAERALSRSVRAGERNARYGGVRALQRDVIRVEVDDVLDAHPLERLGVSVAA